MTILIGSPSAPLLAGSLFFAPRPCASGKQAQAQGGRRQQGKNASFFIVLFSFSKIYPSGLCLFTDLWAFRCAEFLWPRQAWRWGGPAGGPALPLFHHLSVALRQNALFQIQIVLKAHAYMATQADCRRRDGPGVFAQACSRPCGAGGDAFDHKHQIPHRGTHLYTQNKVKNAAGASADLSGLLSAQCRSFPCQTLPVPA